jgi:competence protein ComEA
MLKKLLMLLIALGLSLSAVIATAAVDVNTADEAALESVKGIGPVHAKAIIDERTRGGPFKDADDLANRVKGIGQKSVVNLESAGLTINGSSAPPTGKAAATSKHTKAGTTAGLPAPSPAPAATTAPPEPAATAPATTATKKHRGRKSAAAASEPAAAPSTSTPAATPATADAASAGKAKKPKHSRKSKAASAAAASS